MIRYSKKEEKREYVEKRRVYRELWIKLKESLKRVGEMSRIIS